MYTEYISRLNSKKLINIIGDRNVTEAFRTECEVEGYVCGVTLEEGMYIALSVMNDREECVKAVLLFNDVDVVAVHNGEFVYNIKEIRSKYLEGMTTMFPESKAELLDYRIEKERNTISLLFTKRTEIEKDNRQSIDKINTSIEQHIAKLNELRDLKNHISTHGM